MAAPIAVNKKLCFYSIFVVSLTIILISSVAANVNILFFQLQIVFIVFYRLFGLNMHFRGKRAPVSMLFWWVGKDVFHFEICVQNNMS